VHPAVPGAGASASVAGGGEIPQPHAAVLPDAQQHLGVMSEEATVMHE
jgi:hypothetical protein